MKSRHKDNHFFKSKSISHDPEPNNRQHIKQTNTKQPANTANEGEIQTIFKNKLYIYPYNLRKQHTDSTHIDSDRVGEELMHFLFHFQFLWKFLFTVYNSKTKRCKILSYNLHYVKYSIELQLFKHPLVPHPLLMTGVVSFRYAHPYSILFQPGARKHLRTYT